MGDALSNARAYAPGMHADHAMPNATVRTVRDGTYGTARLQDQGTQSQVPNAPTPVDKGVPLTLPTNVWGRLATIADDRGVTVQQLIVTALRPYLAPQTLETRIRDMARAGLTDQQMCEMTGRDRAFVARTRRAAGIPANKRRSNT